MKMANTTTGGRFVERCRDAETVKVNEKKEKKNNKKK